MSVTRTPWKQIYTSTLVITTGTQTLKEASFNVVTYSGGDTVCTLPDATTCDWQIISVKKDTGEDSNNIYVKGVSSQEVEWSTDGVLFKFDKSVFDFIAVNGNRYVTG